MCRALFDEKQERNVATADNDREQQEMPMPKEHHFHRGLFTVKQCWDGQCGLYDVENTQVHAGFSTS